MLDGLAATGLRPAVLAANAGYALNGGFRHRLNARVLAWVLQAKGEVTAHSEKAMPHQPAYRSPLPHPARLLARAYPGRGQGPGPDRDLA
ncbi:hypothetical protein DQ392_17625 [Streptomyces reniochalinae]|uniref:Transposase IS701-like DDE domain-containing protein n=2 Tax=Streptomyces reniochalinae TaxID=2250578 RepID=A0A367EIS4_9ACTN|nr:hypothetical protein DQ392_17625 [Streptomyces reniochalinae]